MQISQSRQNHHMNVPVLKLNSPMWKQPNLHQLYQSKQGDSF